MSNTEAIILWCVGGFVAIPLGVFITIKTINKLTNPPVNVLRRRGDVELVDYITPSQPSNTYYPNQFDLVNNQYPVLERFSYPPTYQSGVNPPSYRSGTIPSYQSVDRYNIHSCLENENMNLDFIIYLLLFIIISLVILIFIRRYLLKKQWNIDFINPFSTYPFKYIVCWIILFWLITHKNPSNFNLFFLFPFSFFEINFRDNFEWKFNSYKVKTVISYVKIKTLTEDIKNLLISLKEDENYSMSSSFISSYKEWANDKMKIDPLFIHEGIIINKESDPFLLTQFLMNTLNDKGYFHSNDLFKDNLINTMDPVILTVTVPIKVKI